MVRIEKNAAVSTIIHRCFEEARNAMDLDSADALVAAFKKFDV
jgi:enoyl-CoA hydratase